MLTQVKKIIVNSLEKIFFGKCLNFLIYAKKICDFIFFKQP